LEEKKPEKKAAETATISVSSSKIDIPDQSQTEENIPVSAPSAPSASSSAPASPSPTPPVSPPPSPGKIEVAATDIPIKSYDQSRTREQSTADLPKTPAAPAWTNPPTGPTQPTGGTTDQISSGSPAATITVLAILALILGASGGFFGFRYWDRLKTSASEIAASPSPSSPSSTAFESPSLDVNLWPTYSSTSYNFSLKYPNGWLASTTSPTAEDIVFAENQESLAGDLTGFRIEINFQDANGKTLKSWVEANAVATNETKPAKEITVDGQTAYQQELTNNQPAVATFIARGEKIMIVTYTAPAEEMGEGGDWYNNLINSIKLR
jgi:hypothetical protein